MSRPVAIPVGSTLVLDVVCQRYDLVFAGCSEHKITRNYSRVIFSSGRMIWAKFMGPYRPCEGSKCKLHEHVHCRNKKWEGEAEVFWCKHPFVVQRKQRSKDKPKTLQSAFVDLFQRKYTCNIPGCNERQVYERVPPPPPFLLLHRGKVHVARKALSISLFVVMAVC